MAAIHRSIGRRRNPGRFQGLNDDGAGTPVAAIEKSMDGLCREIRGDPAPMSDPSVGATLAPIDARRRHLVAGPVRLGALGGPLLLHPQRASNIPVRFFRTLGGGSCRRAGRPVGDVDVNRLAVDVPLLDNLDNPLYLADLDERCAPGCDGVRRFIRSRCSS